MKKPTIEFNTTSAKLKSCVSPWQVTDKKVSYNDQLLKPEFASRRYKFPLGTTWFRIVPPLKNSDRGWMLGLHTLKYRDGRHAHPRTLKAGSKSVFDSAYTWLKQNRPADLYSKLNKEGAKLLADPICLFWILVEEDGKVVCRLVVASGYDGSRGGIPGPGHQIWQLSQEVDEEGNLIGNPADPVEGAQISIKKRQNQGAKYPSYSMRMGRVPTPIDEMIAKMDSSEAAALTPLEEVVHLPTEEEEWKLLEKVIDIETISLIRESIN